ncbi:copper homeostasis protein [Pseudosporangium ferrugineum]|uniref:Copper homeostasis protein cutC homolog n=1 Tax=Pseudosporangium ferrugineum TaxID=439699 RepID=A0A2T0RWT3_9ACTN|nr:copper homeostasis protein [Pseudosporangium ferrugineum]
MPFSRVWDDAPVPISILEVIALTPADAVAAREGGADRVELVTDMRRQGLTPAIATYAAVREAGLPVRVMLRGQDGYALGDAEGLVRAAAALREAGADEFVLGFLDAAGAVDLAAVEAVLTVIEGCRWTFHRAIDHAADRAAAWAALSGLPGLDCVLTAGGPDGVGAGLATLVAEAGHRPRVLAGGGLRPGHVAPLLDAGVDAFHTGSAVRPGGRWDAPVDAALVRAWRALA